MTKKQEIVCTGCPLGCRVTLPLEESNDIAGVSGASCKAGEKYAVREHKFPNRVLTTTVLAEGRSETRLPVKSSRPVPKHELARHVKSLAGVEARPPVKPGDIIVRNFLDTGVDLIATGKLD